MDQNKVRKYLLYAIGEILLVVIGILIALQVNNWNQLNKDREVSVAYHSRMITDIEQMEIRLQAEISRSGDIRQSLSKAVSILENQTFNDSTEAILNQALIRYFQMAPVSFQISSYDEMKSTGRLNLIYDVELRQRLNGYASYATAISSITEGYSESVNSSKDLFNRYIRIYVGQGSTHEIVYDKAAIAENPILINTISRFAYEWDGYTYFLGVMVEQMNELKLAIQQDLDSLTG